MKKAFNIIKDGYLYLCGFSEIDGPEWSSEDETTPDQYQEFSTKREAQEIIDERKIEGAEIVECDSRWSN